MRYALCTQNHWSLEDGSFSLASFYQALMDLFTRKDDEDEDDEEDPWIKNTMDYFNKYVSHTSLSTF